MAGGPAAQRTKRRCHLRAAALRRCTSSAPRASLTIICSSILRHLIASNRGIRVESTGNLSISASAVPEPGTYGVICGVVVLGLAAYRRRERRG